MSEADTRQWSQTIQTADLGPASQQALSNLLGRLRVTAHYRLAAEDLCARAHTLLEQLKSRPGALASCAALAVEGTQTCDDRIALAFLLMEESLLHHQAMESIRADRAAHTLGNIARGLYKSAVLRHIADEKVKTITGFIDPTEIILKYWVNLSGELQLPCRLDDMIFHQCALSVTDEDIAAAEAAVKQAAQDNDRFETFLTTWAPWQAMLEHRYPDEFVDASKKIEAYVAECHQKLEDLMAERDAIGKAHGEDSTHFLEKTVEMNRLTASIDTYRVGVLKRLTEVFRLNAVTPP